MTGGDWNGRRWGEEGKWKAWEVNASAGGELEWFASCMWPKWWRLKREGEESRKCLIPAVHLEARLFTWINPRIMISSGPRTCHLHTAVSSLTPSSSIFSTKLPPLSLLPPSLFQPTGACYRLYMLYFFWEGGNSFWLEIGVVCMCVSRWGEVPVCCAWCGVNWSLLTQSKR